MEVGNYLSLKIPSVQVKGGKVSSSIKEQGDVGYAKTVEVKASKKKVNFVGVRIIHRSITIKQI